MAIDARTIEEREFKTTVLRGYNIMEVDDFLDEVAGEVDSMLKRIAELEAQVKAWQDRDQQLKDLEQTLRDTLITGQRAAEDVMRASREKSAAMIKDSELEGRRILEDAELRAQAAQKRLEGITRDVSGVKSHIRKVVADQLKLIEESYPDPEPVQPAPQPVKPAQPALPTLADFDRTQEFSTREVREQLAEEERPAMSRFRNLMEKLPQIEENGDSQM